MSDVADRITEYLASGGLWNPELMQHEQVRDLLIDCRTEITSLREAIRRLAQQDATLSVCEGAVTVTMDAALTDAEREALHHIIGDVADITGPVEDTIRALLERLG